MTIKIKKRGKKNRNINIPKTKSKIRLPTLE